MTEVLLENGTCLGFGATNAREGRFSSEDLVSFDIEATPSQPDEFAKWMASRILKASARGDEWVVAGFPGPVSSDGRTIGPMVNINGFKDKEIDLVDAMTNADPALGRLLDQGFTLLQVNDGVLAAHAVAERIAEERHQKVAALIIGTGVGVGVVTRDEKLPLIFRHDEDNLDEFGHMFEGYDPRNSYENMISAPALTRRYGRDPRELPKEHSAWLRVGQKAGKIALDISLIRKADLVVPTGGIGAGASDKYKSHFDAEIDEIKRRGNDVQRSCVPEVKFIPPEECDQFEMFGALGVMWDHLTKTAPVAA